MRKRIGAITVLSLLIVMLTTSLCFAGTLELEDSYPRDGAKGLQVENSGVKLYFNQNMINKKNEKANLKSFKLTDEKGKALPIRVLYSPKEKGLVLVLVDNKALESNSPYKLHISGDVMSAAGDTLGKDQVIKFNTVDTGAAVKVNMIMMGLMMVGVIFASSKAAKKQAEKQHEEAALEEKINPYKIAKETGKSVEEVIEEDRKQKEKQRRKIERKQAREARNESSEDDDDEEELSNGNMKVKTARSALAAGSKFAARRKAEAEEAARKRAQAGTTRPKNKGKKKK